MKSNGRPQHVSQSLRPGAKNTLFVRMCVQNSPCLDAIENSSSPSWCSGDLWGPFTSSTSAASSTMTISGLSSCIYVEASAQLLTLAKQVIKLHKGWMFLTWNPPRKKSWCKSTWLPQSLSRSWYLDTAVVVIPTTWILFERCQARPNGKIWRCPKVAPTCISRRTASFRSLSRASSASIQVQYSLRGEQVRDTPNTKHSIQ